MAGEGAVGAAPGGASGTTGGGAAPPVAAPGAQPADVKPTPPAPPQPEGKTPEPPKKDPIKWKMKFDGKEEEMEFRDLEHLRMEFQRREGISRTYRRDQDAIQRAKKAIDQAKKNPLDVLKELNPDFDFDAEAEKRIIERYKLEQMDPKERELLQTRQELERFKQAEEQQKKTAEEQRLSQEAARLRDQWGREWGTALNGLGYAPEYTKAVLIPRMADVAEMNLEHDMGLSAQDMAAMVQEQVHNEVQGFLRSHDGDSLLAALGPDVVNKVVSAHLRKAQAPEVPTTPPMGAPPPAAPDAPISDDDRRRLVGVERGRSAPRMF